MSQGCRAEANCCFCLKCWPLLLFIRLTRPQNIIVHPAPRPLCLQAAQPNGLSPNAPLQEPNHCSNWDPNTPVKLAARGQVPSAPARPPGRRYDDSWPEHKSPLHTQAPAKDPSTFQRQSMPQHPAEPHSHAPKAEHTGPSGSRTAEAHPEQGSSRHSPAASEVLDEDKPQQEQGTGQGGTRSSAPRWSGSKRSMPGCSCKTSPTETPLSQPHKHTCQVETRDYTT